MESSIDKSIIFTNNAKAAKDWYDKIGEETLINYMDNSRVRLGMTKTNFASALGISSPTGYNKILERNGGGLKARTLMVFCRALGVNLQTMSNEMKLSELDKAASEAASALAGVPYDTLMLLAEDMEKKLSGRNKSTVAHSIRNLAKASKNAFSEESTTDAD